MDFLSVRAWTYENGPFRVRNAEVEGSIPFRSTNHHQLPEPPTHLRDCDLQLPRSYGLQFLDRTNCADSRP